MEKNSFIFKVGLSENKYLATFRIDNLSHNAEFDDTFIEYLSLTPEKFVQFQEIAKILLDNPSFRTNGIYFYEISFRDIFWKSSQNYNDILTSEPHLKNIYLNDNDASHESKILSHILIEYSLENWV